MEENPFDIKEIPIYECDILDEPEMLSDNVSTPSVPVKAIIPVSPVKNFICAHCTSVHVFKSRSGLLRHEKKCHPEVPRRCRWKKKRAAEKISYKTAQNVICREDNCEFRCYKIGQLRRHLHVKHDFNISPPETLQFDSMSNFEIWKKNHELATQSKFVRRWTRADGAYEYLCNRSGSYRSQSKGFRQPRLAGSLKSGGHCTARIILYNGKSKPDLKDGIQIIFYPTHYGHSTYTSMNKRKIMQENKRKQRIMAANLASEMREANNSHLKKTKRTSKLSSASLTRTSKKRNRTSQPKQDFQNVIEEIESNLQTIKTMQTESLADDKSKDKYKLIFVNSNTLSQSIQETAVNIPLDTEYFQNDFLNSNKKSGPLQLPGRSLDEVRVENTWDTASQTDETMASERILEEPNAVYGTHQQPEIFPANNNCAHSQNLGSHLDALNIEMDRLYSLKPYLNKIATADDSTRILTLVNFVHDSIVEVLAQNI